LQSWEVDTLVVGLPRDGTDAEAMARRIRHFTGLLDFNGRVVFVDESFSSKEAEAMSRGVFRQKRDGRVDSVAAQLILERYLFSLASSSGR
jgi:putative Holliday junction resolvase